MRIRINDTIVDNEYNSIQELDIFWRQIINEFSETNQIIQYILINDQIYYEDFEYNLIQKFNGMNKLEIHTISEQQLLIDTINECINYLSKVLDRIDSISEIFYKEITEEDWGTFSYFVQGIEWIYATVESSVILIDKHRIEIFNTEELIDIREGLGAQIRELEESLNVKDYINVGDIIDYEFKTLLTKLKDLLSNARVN